MQADIKIFFIGGITPSNDVSYTGLKSISPVQAAAENFQRSFLRVLKSNHFSGIKFISQPYLGVFPFHTMLRKYTPSPLEQADSQFFNDDLLSSNFCSFSCLPIFSSYQRESNILKSISAQINDLNCTVVLFVYAIHLPFIRAAVKLKKKFGSRFKIILIIPDLIHYMSNYKGFKGLLVSLIKNLQTRELENYIDGDNIDGFIYFSELMSSKFINSKPYIVINGIPPTAIDDDKQSTTPQTSCEFDFNEKFIFYSGILSQEYGIDILIDSFNKVISTESNKNTLLVICGSGPSADTVKDLSQINKNVIFLGQVSNKVARELQAKASVLVNPRPSYGEFTSFSFPSKMFEYLRSGTPIVGFKLPPYDSIFCDLIFIPSEDTSNAFADSIVKVLNLNICELENLKSKTLIYLNKHCSDGFFGAKISDLIKRINHV